MHPHDLRDSTPAFCAASIFRRENVANPRLGSALIPVDCSISDLIHSPSGRLAQFAAVCAAAAIFASSLIDILIDFCMVIKKTLPPPPAGEAGGVGYTIHNSYCCFSLLSKIHPPSRVQIGCVHSSIMSPFSYWQNHAKPFFKFQFICEAVIVFIVVPFMLVCLAISASWRCWRWWLVLRCFYGYI